MIGPIGDPIGGLDEASEVDPPDPGVATATITIRDRHVASMTLAYPHDAKLSVRDRHTATVEVSS